METSMSFNPLRSAEDIETLLFSFSDNKKRYGFNPLRSAEDIETTLSSVFSEKT